MRRDGKFRRQSSSAWNPACLKEKKAWTGRLRYWKGRKAISRSGKKRSRKKKLSLTARKKNRGKICKGSPA